MSRVIVVGGGAAGMMAAIVAARAHEVILVEKNETLGKKLLLTGGGRCNLTSSISIDDFFEKIPRNKKFLFSAFKNFNNKDLISFFESQGNIKFKSEGIKVYPKSDSAKDILEEMILMMKKHNVKIMTNKKVVDFDLEKKELIFDNKEKLVSDYIVFSTGGATYAATGSDGKITRILKDKGLDVKPMRGSLKSIIIENPWTDASGISIDSVLLSLVNKKGKLKKEIKDSIVITHRGISGPAALNMSSYMIDDQELELYIDFLPQVTSDEIISILKNEGKKQVSNIIKQLLPIGIIKEILSNSILEKRSLDLTKEDEKSIIEGIKHLKIQISKDFFTTEGMVTAGGISVKEVNPSTMESKKFKGVYFCGEMLDLDAETGGYNLQIAFSTAYLCGRSISLEK